MPNQGNRCGAHGHLAKTCPLKKLSKKTRKEATPPQPHPFQDGKAPCVDLIAKSKFFNKKPNEVRAD